MKIHTVYYVFLYGTALHFFKKHCLFLLSSLGPVKIARRHNSKRSRKEFPQATWRNGAGGHNKHPLCSFWCFQWSWQNYQQEEKWKSECIRLRLNWNCNPDYCSHSADSCRSCCICKSSNIVCRAVVFFLLSEDLRSRSLKKVAKSKPVSRLK